MRSRLPRLNSPGETAPEQDLIERAVADFQAGRNREDSFRVLVESHYSAVKGFLAKRIFSAEDSLDLTQEVFLSVYRGLDDFRGEARFRTWLFQIVHYAYLSWLRKRLREGAEGPEGSTTEDTGPETAFEEHQRVSVTPPTQADELLQKERLKKLREAIDELPDQMRRCIQLRTYQDCSYKKIASFLGLSIDTVKVHLHVARKKLKEKLRDCDAQPTQRKGGTP